MDTTAPRTAFDEMRFRDGMQQVDVAAELFLPFTHAAWKDGRTVVERSERPRVETHVSGVRLQAADPTREDPTRERETQGDLVRLIASLQRLRAQDGLDALVLSGGFSKSASAHGRGKRVKFGLSCDPDGRYPDEASAARQCHRAIRRSIRKAHLRVLEPKATFDPATGLAGLQAWASQLVLGEGFRIPRFLPWLLLLLLPLLSLAKCDHENSILGVPIEHDNLIVVLDKSGSMAELFPLVRTEVGRTLARMQNGMFRTCHVDLIVYDDHAESALGGLTEVSDDTATRLDAFLAGLQASGGTRLRPAAELAAEEIRRLGQSTTVVIFTDGKGDGSVNELVTAARRDVFKDLGDGVEVTGDTLTPRLLTPEGSRSPAPATPEENDLAQLAHALGGRFGPLGETP